MADPQKMSMNWTLPSFVQNKIREYIGQLGLSLPANVVSVDGAIVTVAFDVSTGVVLPTVTMPVAGPEYLRLPVQVGDLGVCLPVDAYIGANSGLGSSTQTSLAQANLSNLVFFPIGNKNWTAVDPDAVTIYGPNGVVLRDLENKTVQTLTPSGINISAQDTYQISAGTSITLAVGSHSIVIDSSGITLDGVPFLPHTHSGVQTGSGDSGPVVP